MTVRLFFKLLAFALAAFGGGTGFGFFLGFVQFYTPPTFELVQDFTVLDAPDGDTVAVQINGKRTVVRLMGVDTPETRDTRKAKQCGGDKAKERTQALVGTRMRFEFLEAAWPPVQRDRNGRTLAHLFRPNGSNYNEELIRDGLAHQYTYRGPYKYRDQYREAEKSARERGTGIWQSASCAAESTRPRQ